MEKSDLHKLLILRNVCKKLGGSRNILNNGG